MNHLEHESCSEGINYITPLPFKKLLRKWWPSHSTVHERYVPIVSCDSLCWGVASLLSCRAFRRGAYPECLRPQLWSCLGHRTYAACRAARWLGFATSCKEWRCGREVSQWSLGPFQHAMFFLLLLVELLLATSSNLFKLYRYRFDFIRICVVACSGKAGRNKICINNEVMWTYWSSFLDTNTAHSLPFGREMGFGSNVKIGNSRSSGSNNNNNNNNNSSNNNTNNTAAEKWQLYNIHSIPCACSCFLCSLPSCHQFCTAQWGLHQWAFDVENSGLLAISPSMNCSI